nr:hypothetical protein DGKKSRWO_DGKKSRWO_CDS_0162 [uncultured phage]CAI9752341.1 hypothetical protein CVNMHQAP_CVNMHQAP_CDS_0164 [uncultured phage]
MNEYTCKYCIHDDVCLHHNLDEELFWCTSFKNKASYVESLLVSVGMKLYKIRKYKFNVVKIQEIVVTELNCKEIKGKVQWGFVAKTTETHSINRYSFSTIGKTVFYTRSQAEIAVRNSNNVIGV